MVFLSRGIITALASLAFHRVAALPWTVVSGSCTVSDNGNCIQSPNYPGGYPLLHSCMIDVDVNHWQTHQIASTSFNTEACCDRMTVNGEVYSGWHNPGGVSPNQQIVWTSDQNTARDGWKLCSASCNGPCTTTMVATSTIPPTSTADSLGSGQVSVSTAAPTGSSDDDDDNSTVVIIVVVSAICTVLIVSIACFLFMRARTAKAKTVHPVSTASSAPPKTTASAPAPTSASTPATAGPAPVSASTSAKTDGGRSSAVSDTSGDDVGKAKSATSRRGSRDVSQIVLPASEKMMPSYWRNKDFTGRFFKLELVSKDVEASLQRTIDASYKQVRTRDRTDANMPRRLKITKAQRVENAELWRRYVTERYAVGAKRKHRCTETRQYGGELVTAANEHGTLKPQFVSKVNETYLWHGTSPTSATGIIEHGFRLDLAGRATGSMYGPGMYFAEYCSKSDEYAKDDSSGSSKGLFCLLMCRVVLGEMLHMTTGGEATHSMISEALQSQAYDSVLGDREASVGTYREFVVYQDAAAYPEYLVLYRREF